MEKIDYAPVAGLGIKEAIERAKKMACEKHVIVVTMINDIVLHIAEKTNVETALVTYHQKLDKHYEKILNKKQKLK